MALRFVTDIRLFSETATSMHGSTSTEYTFSTDAGINSRPRETPWVAKSQSRLLL